MVQRYGEVMSLHTYGHSYENRSLIVAKVDHHDILTKNIFITFVTFLSQFYIDNFFTLGTEIQIITYDLDCNDLIIKTKFKYYKLHKESTIKRNLNKDRIAGQLYLQQPELSSQANHLGRWRNSCQRMDIYIFSSASYPQGRNGTFLIRFFSNNQFALATLVNLNKILIEV